MIKSKEHQPQPPIFDLKHIISRKKIEFTNSSLCYNVIKDRGRLKKKVAKRSSCHNFSTDNRENESGQFSTKLLDHIFTQIKHNYNSCQKSKQEGSIIHSVIQKDVQITSNDGKELNRQNNLRIKSINNQIKPKTQKSCRNKACSTPFQNKKLMNLRKGKSYTLYTQQIEPQVTEPSNEAKILPWEFYNNHIIDLPGTPHQIDDQTPEQQYLKSHHLRPKQQKKFASYNTLAFAIPQEKKPSYKKYSSIDVTQAEKEKPIKSFTHYNQVFSTNSVKERTYWPVHCRGKKNINRTLAQMKMDVDQIQLQKPNQNAKNINLEDFFQCAIPKKYLAEKNRTNYPNKISNSYRRVTQQSRKNCILVGRKI